MSTRNKRLLFIASVLLYHVLHEVVYGLMGFRFFVDASFAQLVLTFAVFVLVRIIQKPMRRYLEQRLDWSENPVKRLWMQSVLFAGLSALMVMLVRVVVARIQLTLSDDVFVSLQSVVIDYLLLVVVIELNVLLEFGAYLLQKWNSSRYELANFQKEKAQFSLELLRTQINPHFLFNNLNTLSSLIYSDQDKAAAFLRKLSGVYRSILEYRNTEQITLEEELRFFEQYKELLEIRFENMLFFNLHITPELYPKHMIPLTLQMLVENAIKHNVLSQANPLTISIETANGYVLVENNYQPKESLEYSSGLGLKMIENRYAYLSKLPVVVDKTVAHFLVKIPLLD
jgi:sensor histidine kinase YesM